MASVKVLRFLCLKSSCARYNRTESNCKERRVCDETLGEVHVAPRPGADPARLYGRGDRDSGPSPHRRIARQLWRCDRQPWGRDRTVFHAGSHRGELVLERGVALWLRA